MFKRILVALDGSEYSQFATRWAFRLARRHDAIVTGVAIVDTESIESKGIGAGIGSYHYAEHLQEVLEEKATDFVEKCLSEFHELGDDEGIQHRRVAERGVPFETLLEDLNYHDMLIIGKKTFFSEPDQEKPDDLFLDKVAGAGAGPVLSVPKKEPAFNSVLAAVTGKTLSSSTLQTFLRMDFKKNINIHLLHCNDNQEQGHKILSQYQEYCKDYGHPVSTHLKPEADSDNTILEKAEETDSDMILMGAHDKPDLVETLLGSTTIHILTNANVPVFLTH